MNGYLAVFIGAGIGGSLRHAVNLGSLRLFGPHLPLGTLAINVTGSFLIGVVAGTVSRDPAFDRNLHLFLATGLLGGFTTFSAFSLEGVLMWQRGQQMGSLLYAAGSVVLGLLAAAAGLALTRP